jgi:periplasmic protein TonB
MATHRISIFGPKQDAPAKKTAGPLRLPSAVKNDVFLNALLEMPTTQQTRRSPLKWLGAMGFHIVIVAVLIVVPLYTTGTIRLSEYHEIPVVAPPPPLAPPPAPAGGPVAPHITRPKAKLNYTLQKLTAPTAIPKNVSSDSENVSEGAPDFGGVPGGVPGGVIGGQIGGVIGGVLGGTGTAAPTPPPVPRPVPKVVRVGGHVKAPRQTYSVNPAYPPLAREARIWGTVVVDAVIDERGNVVQARVVSGHPLLIDAALKAVLQWKYEPTTLNGQPVSVELQVQVHFNLNS